MAENLKSASITGRDSQPSTQASSGQGASGVMRTIGDHVACTAGATAPSTYRICHVPTNACIKQVLLTNAAGGGGAVDIDIAFSDNPNESANYQGYAGGVVQITGPVDNKLFGSAVAVSAAQPNKDQTFAGTFTPAFANMPLWQVLVALGATQFTSDPGGEFDFVLKTTTAITNAADLALEVRFVVDG